METGTDLVLRSGSTDQNGRAADRLFNQACMYDDSRPEILTCYDLVVPDPGIADLLQSVRYHLLKWSNLLKEAKLNGMEFLSSPLLLERKA
jgi:hypothetical protein